MQLNVAFPDRPERHAAARRYIHETLLSDFLGLSFTEERHGGAETIITCPGSPGRLHLPDILLRASDWLEPTSLPNTPLDRWQHVPRHVRLTPGYDDLPILYGRRHASGDYLWRDGEALHLGVDVFGSCLFMLGRYEELVRSERDVHGRFAYHASLAAQENIVLRPLVNEYVELLWTSLQQLWPHLRRRSRQARLFLSHDVDIHLWNNDHDPRRLLKALKADLGGWRDASRGRFSLSRSVVDAWRGRYDHDPFNTYAWLMDRSERLNVHAAFNFIAAPRHAENGGSYELTDPWVRHLMRHIHTRGHEIGLHPSYGTYRDPERIKHEWTVLRETTNALGIDQPAWGGRQHYLRWEAPTTWQSWADAGLTYDSSVGFADHVGFRAGTCYEYRTFNLLTGQPLPLFERPLVVMDASLLQRNYMNLQPQEALKVVRALIRACARFQGDFALLWHNSQFVRASDVWLFDQILDEYAGVLA